MKREQMNQRSAVTDGIYICLEKGFYEGMKEAEIKGICSILQSLARITFTKGELFHAYEFVYTGQT